MRAGRELVGAFGRLRISGAPARPGARAEILSLWPPAFSGASRPVDGGEPGALALVVLGQQAVVFLRILARTAHLGAASAFLARAAETPARRAPAVSSESEPAAVVDPAPEP